jgi:hypothetical protein
MDVDGSAGASAAGRSSGIATSIVRKEDEERTPWLPVLQKRVVQHNVRVAAKWYTRLSSARLAALLGLDADTTELVVSELAADKAIYAKFDRPAGACERAARVSALRRMPWSWLRHARYAISYLPPAVVCLDLRHARPGLLCLVCPPSALFHSLAPRCS